MLVTVSDRYTYMQEHMHMLVTVSEGLKLVSVVFFSHTPLFLFVCFVIRDSFSVLSPTVLELTL